MSGAGNLGEASPIDPRIQALKLSLPFPAEKAWSPKWPRLSSPPVVHGLGTDLTDRLFVVTRRLKIYNGAELEARMPIMKTGTRFQFWAVRFIFRAEAAQ
jgi:hypothetical protein